MRVQACAIKTPFGGVFSPWAGVAAVDSPGLAVRVGVAPEVVGQEQAPPELVEEQARVVGVRLRAPPSPVDWAGARVVPCLAHWRQQTRAR
jgi:hypothetical protein